MAGFNNEYAYTDFHELNADFMLNKIAELEHRTSVHYMINANYVADTETLEIEAEEVPENE